MIRLAVLAVSFCAFAWLVYESVHFRQQIRTDLAVARSELRRIDPDSAGGTEKILNFYYESIYRDLPNILVPGMSLLLACAILYAVRKPPNA